MPPSPFARSSSPARPPGRTCGGAGPSPRYYHSHGLRFQPQADGHVRRPVGFERPLLRRHLGVERRARRLEREDARAERQRNSSPPPRTQQVMVYDTVQKKTFLFSGWQPQAGFFIPDQWEWDGTTWNERVIAAHAAEPAIRRDQWSGTPIATAPCCSAASARTTTRARRPAATTSGSGTAAAPAPGPTGRRAAARQPSPRMYHSAVYDAFRKKMVVFSGYTGTGAATTGTWVDETWEWDGTGTAGVWTKVTTASGTRSPSYYSQSATPASATTAGRTRSSSTSRPTMSMSGIRRRRPGPRSPPPGTETPVLPALHSTLTYDPLRAVLVIVGGYYNPRDPWELNTTDYSMVNRSSPPAAGVIQRRSRRSRSTASAAS